nr:carboxylesterase 3 [Arma chinensis]
MRWFCLVAFLILASCSALELKTRKGSLQGTEESSRNGRKYYAFRGIPYAQPPVGKLRLRNPQPHNGWKGILDATEEAPICIQRYIFIPDSRNTTIGQEDCLILNIYTPDVDKSRHLPVLAYIHGGGFRCGRPGPKESPSFFMDEDVVLVTIQYRVGIFGFLSTEDRLIPGNFGLKDQAMALKWLSENINEYGGNPDSIIVFGESAGGASTHYLITSPLSRDLVKGAISESGVLDGEWALSHPGDAKETSEKVAKIVGCSSSPLLECLQSIEADKLVAIETGFLEWDFDPAVIFKPVVEEENEGAFITEDPRSVKVSHPWITGYTNGEGLLKTASLVNQDKSLVDYFVKNIDKLLPMLLFVNPKSPRIDELVTMVKERYFRNLRETKQVLDQLETFYTDLYFIHPMLKALKRHVGPKYAYFLSHRAENSLADTMGEKKLDSPKASHVDELISLFDWSSVFSESKGRPEDRKISELLVKIWVNFAKSRNPTLEGVPIKWSPFSGNNFLHIQTEDTKMENIPLDEITEFWSRAYGVLEPTHGTVKEEL